MIAGRVTRGGNGSRTVVHLFWLPVGFHIVVNLSAVLM